MANQNNHSPPSKRKLKIAKLEQKLANRLKQKNTDKKEKDVAKLQKRIKKLTTNIPTGKRGRLKSQIEQAERRIKTTLWDSTWNPYWIKEKEKLTDELRKYEAGKKKEQRQRKKKKLSELGIFPKKRGVKPYLDPQERKRRAGLRTYFFNKRKVKETELKNLFQEVFGKEEGQKKWLVTKQRQSKYKDKEDGGWFSKWTKKIEKRLIKADKSLTKSGQKKELIVKSKKAKSPLKKKPYSWGWDRWIDSENKRLDKLITQLEKEQEEIIGGCEVKPPSGKETADTWSIYCRATDSKKDKGSWYWGKYKVINDYTGEIGIWDNRFNHILNLAKQPISGKVIDYDSQQIWTERLW